MMMVNLKMMNGQMSLRRSRNYAAGGFTLIELLVVVVIIAVLAAICLPRLFQAIQTAKQGRTIYNLGNMRGALSRYFLDHGEDVRSNYPWLLNQILSCGTHSGKHSYMNFIPAEEVGDGALSGGSICDWCTLDHTYHVNRTVQGADKGGWNYCVPGGNPPPDPEYSSGTVWIDEDETLFNGKPANES